MQPRASIPWYTHTAIQQAVTSDQSKPSEARNGVSTVDYLTVDEFGGVQPQLSALLDPQHSPMIS